MIGMSPHELLLLQSSLFSPIKPQFILFTLMDCVYISYGASFGGRLSNNTLYLIKIKTTRT